MHRFRCRRAARHGPAGRPFKHRIYWRFAAGLSRPPRSILAIGAPRLYIGGMTTIDDIVENFTLLDEWDDRYRYVIELGRTLAAAAGRRSHRSQQGARLRQPGLAAHPCEAGRRRRPDAELRRRQRRPYRARPDRHSAGALFRQARERDPGYRRARFVRAHSVARWPDAATLERPALDGRAHPRRSQSRAGAGLTRARSISVRLFYLRQFVR